MITIKGVIRNNINRIKNNASVKRSENASCVDQLPAPNTMYEVPLLSNLCWSPLPFSSSAQGIAHAEITLDELTHLQQGLLKNSSLATHQQRIEDILKTTLADDLSPELFNLLQEVQVRAAVELAKLKK